MEPIDIDRLRPGRGGGGIGGGGGGGPDSGDGGRDRPINLRPSFNISPQPIIINLDKSAMQQLMNSGNLTYKTKYGHIKIHERAIKRF